jgi:prepilin-type N-terminal cleavage/methylation domain-containing protein
MHHNNKIRGFTLIELIVSISIVTVITAGITVAVFWGMRLWNITQDNIKAQDIARAAFLNTISEIRKMQISDNGSYAIDTATQNSLIFYSNVDSDTNREKIQYELSNGTLFRWVEDSDTQTPPQYPAFSVAHRTIVVQNINNGSLPAFEYFDDTYTGTTAPLSYPIQINEVRLIKLHLLIDANSDRSPLPLELQTSIELRNLKDNL